MTGLFDAYPLAEGIRIFIRNSVESGSTVHTDRWRGYAGLEQAGYVYQLTPTLGDDASTAPAFPHVHWVVSMLKRWLTGTHQAGIGSKHLQLYLVEFTFRLNRCKFSTFRRNILSICGTIDVATNHHMQGT